MHSKFVSFSILDLQSLALSFCCVALLCLTCVYLRKRFLASSIREQHWLHEFKAVRHGGLCVISVFTLFGLTNDAVANEITFAIVFSAVPLLIAGFLEDIGVKLRPYIRLAAAFLGASIAVNSFEYSITYIGVPWLDHFLLINSVSIMFTVFATATLSHSFNLIDGLNGLASGTALIALLTFNLVAIDLQSFELRYPASLLMFSLAGFLLINLITGRVFLGDAGAYFLGHCVAWFSVITANLNPDVSPWFFVVICIVPIADTVTSITRRLIERKSPATPDNQHFHHIVYFVIKNRSNLDELTSNNLASILIVLFTGSTAAISYGFRTNNELCMLLACSLFVAQALFIFLLRKAQSKNSGV